MDTSFIIDLLRDIAKNQRGAAHRFLDTVLEDSVGVSVFVVCELFMGAELSVKASAERERVQTICDSLHIDFPDQRFAPTFARNYARQERSGQRISTRDLLIGTSAMLADAPLVTRNTKDFSRFVGLKVIEY